MNGIKHRARYNLHIQEEMPMLDIPNIILDALLHLPNLVREAAIAVDLRPSGNAWLDHMAHHVFVYQLSITLGLLEHMRTRPYNGHVAEKDINKLWQLVQRSLAQKIAYFGFARIVLGGLRCIRRRIYTHRTEFQAIERAASVSCTFLLKEYRPG